MSQDQNSNFLHLILMLLLAMTNFFVSIRAKDMQQRIVELERLLEDFTEAIDRETHEPPH